MKQSDLICDCCLQWWANPNYDWDLPITDWGWFDSLEIWFGSRRLGFDLISIFLRFDLGREIWQANHCWLLLISPFQCLIVSPVELTGLTWFSCCDCNWCESDMLLSSILFSLFLNTLMLLEETVSSSRAFQRLITQYEKKYFLTSFWHPGLLSLANWPRVPLLL